MHEHTYPGESSRRCKRTSEARCTRRRRRGRARDELAEEEGAPQGELGTRMAPCQCGRASGFRPYPTPVKNTSSRSARSARPQEELRAPMAGAMATAADNGLETNVRRPATASAVHTRAQMEARVVCTRAVGSRER